MDACALCAVPNASFTYTSAKAASSAANFGSFLRLLHVESKVFEQKHFAVGQIEYGSLHVLANAIVNEADIHSQEFSKVKGHRTKTQFRSSFTFRPSQV